MSSNLMIWERVFWPLGHVNVKYKSARSQGASEDNLAKAIFKSPPTATLHFPLLVNAFACYMAIMAMMQSYREYGF